MADYINTETGEITRPKRRIPARRYASKNQYQKASETRQVNKMRRQTKNQLIWLAVMGTVLVVAMIAWGL